MGLPQVPLGSHIRPSWQTDRNMQTHTHTVRPLPKHSLLQYASSHTPKAWRTLHKSSDFALHQIFFRHKIIFHPSSLYMLHGSFEMNNGNNRAEDSWDPFKDVGEALQSGFGLQKHQAPSKWICYCSVHYGNATIDCVQTFSCQQWHDVNAFSFKSGKHQ